MPESPATSVGAEAAVAGPLRRAAAALARCHARLAVVDAELADLLGRAAAMRPVDLLAMQELDLAIQEIDGLARFLEDLAAAVRPDGGLTAIALTSRQTLEDLAGRLAGDEPAEQRPIPTGGACELF